MVSDPIGMTSKVEKFLDIDSRKQLNLLRNRQVTEFNKYLEQGIPIHLPFEKLSGFDLHDFSLEGSLLFRSNLSGANLFGANLSGANLIGANLLKAVIINCKFSNAIIDTHTDFSNAIIDNPDFLKHLHEKGCQNIPDEIRNKPELRERIAEKGFQAQ